MARKPKTIKKKIEKVEAKKPTISFSIDGNVPESLEKSTNSLSYENIGDRIREGMGLSKAEKPLAKAVKPITVEKDVDGKYSQSKVVFATRDYGTNPDNVLTKGYQRLTDGDLRQLTMMDPYISAIITTRVSQGGITGQKSDSKFDKGCRVEELNPHKRDDFDTEEEFEREQSIREAQMKTIMTWMLNCGTRDKDIINYAFRGADPTFKFCSLKDYIQAQVRNLLTFGRIGAQKFKNQEGVTVMFRPVPVETIYPVDYGQDTSLTNSEETANQSIEDEAEYEKLKEDERPQAWVQKIDGKNVNLFTDDDLAIWYYQKQALYGLQGFPLAPIEMAIYMTFIHQQTLSYLRNQFVKGMATKGLIVLESTNPNVQLSDADLEDFKQQFHNFVSRTDNSAVTPVIGGPVKAQWVPLTINPRDMEFLQVEEHVIRALCSAFQISPQEMGYGHLSLPQGSLSSANKQEDIIKGEERGLRMILDVIFEGLNEMLWENFPEAEGKYYFTYVGVGEDTRDAVTQRQTAELQTTATMSSLFADSEKSEPISIGGSVPLAPLFHQNIVRYMKYGMFMEKFFGMEGWSQKPEYDFIIDPTMNQAYQQLRAQPMKLQQEAAELQVEAQAQQMQMTEQQAQQQTQQQQPGQEAQGQATDQATPPSGQEGDQRQEQEGGEQMQQSEHQRIPLLEKYKQSKSKPLEKSIRSYFKEWINAQG